MSRTETMTVLSDMRSDVLKECRSLFKKDFPHLINEHEERSRESKHRQVVDYLVSQMPGADRIESLPRLIEQVQKTRQQVDINRLDLDQKHNNLEAYCNEKLIELSGYNAAMREEQEQMAAKQNRHLTDDLRKVADLRASINSVKFDCDMLI